MSGDDLRLWFLFLAGPHLFLPGGVFGSLCVYGNIWRTETARFPDHIDNRFRDDIPCLHQNFPGSAAIGLYGPRSIIPVHK